jgi:hypothetical protein
MKRSSIALVFIGFILTFALAIAIPASLWSYAAIIDAQAPASVLDQIEQQRAIEATTSSAGHGFLFALASVAVVVLFAGGAFAFIYYKRTSAENKKQSRLLLREQRRQPKPVARVPRLPERTQERIQ